MLSRKRQKLRWREAPRVVLRWSLFTSVRWKTLINWSQSTDRHTISGREPRLPIRNQFRSNHRVCARMMKEHHQNHASAARSKISTVLHPYPRTFTLRVLRLARWIDGGRVAATVGCYSHQHPFSASPFGQRTDPRHASSKLQLCDVSHTDPANSNILVACGPCGSSVLETAQRRAKIKSLWRAIC